MITIFRASLQYFSGDHEKHNRSFGWFCFCLLLIKNTYLFLATQITFCFSTDSSRSASTSRLFFMRLMSVGSFTFHVIHTWVFCLSSIQICEYFSRFFLKNMAECRKSGISGPPVENCSLVWHWTTHPLTEVWRLTLGTTKFLLSLHKNSGVSPLSFKILVCASLFPIFILEQHLPGKRCSPADHKLNLGTVGFHVKLGHGPAVTAFL